MSDDMRPSAVPYLHGTSLQIQRYPSLRLHQELAETKQVSAIKGCFNFRGERVAERVQVLLHGLFTGKGFDPVVTTLSLLAVHAPVRAGVLPHKLGWENCEIGPVSKQFSQWSERSAIEIAPDTTSILTPPGPKSRHFGPLGRWVGHCGTLS